jgi:hypothetical protein
LVPKSLEDEQSGLGSAGLGWTGRDPGSAVLEFVGKARNCDSFFPSGGKRARRVSESLESQGASECRCGLTVFSSDFFSVFFGEVLFWRWDFTGKGKSRINNEDEDKAPWRVEMVHDSRADFRESLGDGFRGRNRT